MSFLEEQVWPGIIPESDVELVMSQTNVTKDVARKLLTRNSGDIVNTIMELTPCQPELSEDFEIKGEKNIFQDLKDGTYHLEVKTTRCDNIVIKTYKISNDGIIEKTIKCPE